MSTVETEQLHALQFAPTKLLEARLRKFPELSRRRVAKDFLGIAHQTLAGYETGRCNPSPDKLLRMCKLYGVELQELGEYALAP